MCVNTVERQDLVTRFFIPHQCVVVCVPHRALTVMQPSLADHEPWRPFPLMQHTGLLKQFVVSADLGHGPSGRRARGGAAEPAL